MPFRQARTPPARRVIVTRAPIRQLGLVVPVVMSTHSHGLTKASSPKNHLQSVFPGFVVTFIFALFLLTSKPGFLFASSKASCRHYIQQPFGTRVPRHLPKLPAPEENTDNNMTCSRRLLSKQHCCLQSRRPPRRRKIPRHDP